VLGPVPGERVHVALGPWAMVLPGRATVGRAHEPAQLDARQDDVCVVRARRNPAEMRRSTGVAENSRSEPTEARAARKAPPSRRYGEPRARSARSPHRRRRRQGCTRPRRLCCGETCISPRGAAVPALERPALAATGQDALRVARVDRNALRARFLESAFRPPVGDTHDGVAGGDEERLHLVATRSGYRPASNSRTKSPRPWSNAKPRPYACW
jgi:hypothetical protein